MWKCFNLPFQQGFINKMRIVHVVAKWSSSQHGHSSCKTLSLLISHNVYKIKQLQDQTSLGSYLRGQTGWIAKHPEQTIITKVIQTLTSNRRSEENLLETRA